MLFLHLAHPARGFLTINATLAWEIERPKSERRHCFTQEEVTMLQDACHGWLKDIVTTLAYTGMHIGELIHLRWQDVDLENGFIHITAREDWSPKNGESRSLPILGEVRSVLLARKLGRKAELAFTGSQGGKINPSHTRDHLVRARKRLNIAQGTPHSFRHFFVSLCANSNVPERVCMTWVGHKDSEMVRHYYHLHDDEAKRAMDRVEEHLEKRNCLQSDTASQKRQFQEQGKTV